jgi:UTP-glucose-1-phosphate uridylyltransferase
MSKVPSPKRGKDEDQVEKTLVIMAAGMGSRYGGVKQLDKFGPQGETLMDYSIKDAVDCGFQKIVVIVRKEILEEAQNVLFAHWQKKIPLVFAVQEKEDVPSAFSEELGENGAFTARTKPWGTGHALLAARKVLSSTRGGFAIINADDYYGRDAFLKMSQFFDQLPSKTTKEIEKTAVNVGYELVHTLSPHGSVSRAILQHRDAILTDIVERKKIFSNPEIYFLTEDNRKMPLTGHEHASLNFWGFTAGIFPMMEKQFELFLGKQKEKFKEKQKQNGVYNINEAEFLIPEVINYLIKEGGLMTHVLATSAQWFGVTYPEDRDFVRNKLKNL